MHTFIIAEAGVNHNGSLELAKKLVDAAALAKADAVKFQTFNAKKLVSVNAKKAEYQQKTTDKNESQLAMIERLQLSKRDHYELKEYCKSKGILFLSSPFDDESVEFLEELELPLFKIPSGEITNYKMLRAIGKTGKKVIMSTGMSDMEEIGSAIRVLEESGAKDIALLHCNTEYPTPFKDVNLLAMDTLRETFHKEVGYSDHTVGIEVPISAVALGATIIEKHFTLDKTMEGPDHKASLEPNELKAMVEAIRHIEEARGSREKKVTESEEKNRAIARKSVVAATTIKKGDIFTEDTITLKRPGTGIKAIYYEDLLGKVAKHDYEEDDLLDQDELEK